MKLILLGPPGSGKGTMAQRMVNDFNFSYFSTGDIFRQAVADKTELGKKVKELIDNGIYVPDEVTIALVKEKIKDKDHYILDGFPRTIPQAESLEDEDITTALYFEVSDEAVIERLSGRRTDPITKKTYHIKFVPPPDEVKDRLIQREDDKPEAIKKRLQVYKDQTQPLIKFYQEKGILTTIDANPPPDEVYKQVQEILS